MSNLDRAPALAVCGGTASVSAQPVQEVLAGREVRLGESTMVRRLLPNLGRRLVGAWCFVDHYGPDDIASGAGMQVPPHPHMGLQTVSWLLDGEVHHRDSLGSSQHVRPGELGLMTAVCSYGSRYRSMRAMVLPHGHITRFCRLLLISAEV
jgi:redox-sensitive bicupin YhaK (pirin superfamily)